MKNTIIILFSIFIISCNNSNNTDTKIVNSALQTEKDIKMYKKVWDTFLL